MRVSINYLILSLYFFVYFTPQYLSVNLLAYDRVYPQMLVISLLNVFSFIYILRNYDFRRFFSELEYKYHFLSYLSIIIISIISLSVAENLIEGIAALVKLINLFLAFCLILILASHPRLKLLRFFITVTLISLFIESVLINYQVIDSVIINGRLLERSNEFAGFGANVNISSFSVLIKSIVPVYLLFNYKNHWIRLVSLVFLYSSFLTILLLMSRAAVLSLILVVVCILFFVILSNKLINYSRYGLIILAILTSVISYNALNEKNTYNILSERFSNVTDPIVDESVNERLNFYTTALQSISEKPLLGIGIGNWKIKSIDFSKEIIENYRVPYFVHNDFLQFSTEIGIIGGICFIFYIFYPLLISFKRVLIQKRFSLDFMIFLIFTIYIVDSMLNFPVERPINYIYLCFTIALFYQTKKTN